MVSGLVRHWGKVNDNYIASPLVSEPGDGLVNGVLLEITIDELKEFDRREAGYQRVRLQPEQFETPLDITAENDIWVYIKPQPQPPCENIPVLQTYIDTVLSGCLEISEDFARFLSVIRRAGRHRLIMIVNNHAIKITLVFRPIMLS